MGARVERKKKEGMAAGGRRQRERGGGRRGVGKDKWKVEIGVSAREEIGFIPSK